MHRLIASWFGAGLILRRVRGDDSGSGTVGAIFAAGLALVIGDLGGWLAQLLATIVVISLSLWSARALASTEGDAGWIVVDEAAGAFLALIGLGLWPGAVVAFVVFRAADIFKGVFPGVSQAERLPSAVGITADDLVAGLYGLIIGHAVQFLL